jgi:hypothetical protein
MRRRGSGSFVVEFRKRRFPQDVAATRAPDRRLGSPQAPAGTFGFSAAPRVETDGISNPAIEAAKIAATRFFSSPGSARSAGPTHRGDPAASGFVPRVVPPRPADAPQQELAATPPASAPPPVAPRIGRILQSLIVAEDPIEALLRREAEEKSARRRRGPRARDVGADGTGAALPVSGKRIPARQTATDKHPAEAPSATDRVAPGRKVRGRAAAPGRTGAGATSTGRPVRHRKKATRAPRRAAAPRRIARAGATRRAAKRAAISSLGKTGVAKRAAARRQARRAALAKTALRKGAKRPVRPAVSAKRAAAGRGAAPGRKIAGRAAAKTKRSAAGTKATRGRKSRGR